MVVWAYFTVFLWDGDLDCCFVFHQDFALTLAAQTHVDSTACKGVASRRGVGRFDTFYVQVLAICSARETCDDPQGGSDGEHRQRGGHRVASCSIACPAPTMNRPIETATTDETRFSCVTFFFVFQTLRSQVPPTMRCKLAEGCVWNLVLCWSLFSSLTVLVSHACLEVPTEIASFRCLDAHINDFSSALCLINRL